MNLVWIVSDTFRTDNLSAYGSPIAKAPNLDSLAARSAVFEEHHAGSFPTVPARSDFLTGKWTFTYRGWEPMPFTEAVLPEILSTRGFRTVGVADTPFYTTGGFAFDRGFDLFTQLDAQMQEPEWARLSRWPLLSRKPKSEFDYPVAQTITTAEKYLERLTDEPFFMLVDTWDPHETWDPPHWYVKRYLADYDGRLMDPPYGDWRAAGISEEDLKVAQACYAGMVTMVDRWIGRLLDRITTLGLAENTAIVFTSDHGFHIGEHGLIGKLVRAKVPDEGTVFGRTWPEAWTRSPLYREVTHVPLIIQVPGVAPSRIGELTSAVDIMPTVVDLLTGSPPEGVHGKSLVPLLGDGAQGTGRDLVVTSLSLQYGPGAEAQVVDGRSREILAPQPATITTREWTALYAGPRDEVELYRATDEFQSSNLAGDYPGVVADLVDRYMALLESVDTPAAYVAARRRA